MKHHTKELKPMAQPPQQIQKFWDHLIGAFIKSWRIPPHNAWNSKCEGSAVTQQPDVHPPSRHTHCEDKFKHEGPPVAMFQTDWKRLHCCSLCECKEWNEQTGKKLSNLRMGSTMEDGKAMACGCFWISRC